MKERPILFSTAMVQAILAGNKTMTRRVIKPQPPEMDGVKLNFIKDGIARFEHDCSTALCDRKCPYGQPGDRLWVRETWTDCCPYPLTECPEGKPKQYDTLCEVCKHHMSLYYKADIEPEYSKRVKWTPSIFMPKVAARIWLEVVSVKVERLQDISEEDAIREGVKAYGPNNCSGTSARIAFAELWDSINEKRGYGWISNPWVGVVEFRGIK